MGCLRFSCQCFYDTSSVHCIVCSPPQIKSPSITIYPAFTLSYLLHPPFPRGITLQLSIYEVSGFVAVVLFLFNCFTFFTQPPYPLPSDSCQSILFIYESVSVLFVILFVRFHVRVKSYGILSFCGWFMSFSIILGLLIPPLNCSVGTEGDQCSWGCGGEATMM